MIRFPRALRRKTMAYRARFAVIHLGRAPAAGLDPARGVLGYRPIEHLAVIGQSFFSHRISGPFGIGPREAFVFRDRRVRDPVVASVMRGGRRAHADESAAAEGPVSATKRERIAT